MFSAQICTRQQQHNAFGENLHKSVTARCCQHKSALAATSKCCCTMLSHNAVGKNLHTLATGQHCQDLSYHRAVYHGAAFSILRYCVQQSCAPALPQQKVSQDDLTVTFPPWDIHLTKSVQAAEQTEQVVHLQEIHSENTPQHYSLRTMQVTTSAILLTRPK